jgi:putative ABC transport system permease protein
MLNDVRFALRQLLKAPGFFIVSVLTLALAIGANTAIFSAIDAVLLHPLAYPDPDKIVMVLENMKHYALVKISPSPQEFAEFRRIAKSFSYLGGVTSSSPALTGDGPPENLTGQRVTASVFPMLGITPIVGTLFTEEDEQMGRHRVAILSEALWIKRFGGDRSIAGKTIQLDRESYQVVGVIRPILDYRVAADVWMPLAFVPAEIAPGGNGPHNIDVIGRLKPGVSLQQARGEFQRIAARMGELYPDRYPANMQFSLDLDPMAERQAGDLRTPLLVLIAAVGALMLIACANVSNLLLARAMLRRKEMSIRAALGAGRWRVIRQLLTESLLLSGLGAAIGVLLAFFALRLYTQFGPQGLIHGSQPAISGAVLAFSLLISIVASVLFGLAPAIDSSRVDLAEALKEGARGSSGGRRWLRESMVVMEVAVSLILLIGAGLLVESFVRLQRTDPGFRAENVLTAQILLPQTDYREPAKKIEFARAARERVQSLPGVRSAGVADFVQFIGSARSSITILGHHPDPNAPTQVVMQSRVTPGYFRAMGIPILRGRDFTPSDEQGSPPVTVIDETVVKNFFADMDPIGMQVNLPIARGDFTVIGVAGATKSFSLSGDPVASAYYFGPQIPNQAVTLTIKTAGDPSALIGAVRREVAAIDSNLPVIFKPMEQVLAESLARQRFSIQLMALFAGVAALLAAIGIYGVLAYLVDQRQRELGIRMALGARAGNVFALVLRQGSIPVAAGLIIGIAGALGLTRLLKTLLYNVSPYDPFTFAAFSLGLVAIALLAMAVPAVRATRVDPLDALRHE